MNICLTFFVKKGKQRNFLKVSFGGDDGIRTHDPLLAGQVLSQLSYTPVLFRVSGLFAFFEQSLKIEQQEDTRNLVFLFLGFSISKTILYGLSFDFRFC